MCLPLGRVDVWKSFLKGLGPVFLVELLWPLLLWTVNVVSMRSVLGQLLKDSAWGGWKNQSNPSGGDLSFSSTLNSLVTRKTTMKAKGKKIVSTRRFVSTRRPGKLGNSSDRGRGNAPLQNAKFFSTLMERAVGDHLPPRSPWKSCSGIVVALVEPRQFVISCRWCGNTSLRSFALPKPRSRRPRSLCKLWGLVMVLKYP